jgi:hypothetical protein
MREFLAAQAAGNRMRGPTTGTFHAVAASCRGPRYGRIGHYTADFTIC